MLRSNLIAETPTGIRIAPGGANAEPSAPRLTLRANFAWTLASNLVYAACQWGILVCFAQLTSPEAVGVFSLGLAITAPVFLLANLNLRSVQATDARGEHPFGDYLGLRLVTTAGALLGVAGICVIAGYPWETVAVVLVIGVAKALESVSDTFHGLLQQHERMDRIAVSMMARGLLSLGMVVSAVYLTGSVLWASIGLAATWALVLLCYDLWSPAVIFRPGVPLTPLNPLRPRWVPRSLARLAWVALPLGLVMCLISLTANLPRYFLEPQEGGLAKLGIFAALSYLVVAGGTVVNALGQSATPRLAQYFAAGERRAFAGLLFKLMVLSAVLGAGGILIAYVAGRPLLTLLYGPDYGEHPWVFLWLMVAAMLGYVASCLGYAITAARSFQVQLPLFLAVGLVTLLACFILIPTWGLVGAAFAVVITAGVQLIGSGLVLYWIACKRGRAAA